MLAGGRMPTKEEIEMVIEWCEKKKAEKGRTPLIELNPFRHIPWLRNKTTIQIDMPLERANPMGLVYESTLKALYEYVNGVWRRIE
jgi:hypothetical protein